MNCTNCGATWEHFYVEETQIYNRMYWNDETKILEVRADRGETDSCAVRCGDCGAVIDVEIEWY